MAHITLIVGGGRSGKSAYAQRLAEQTVGAKLFIATGQALDAEMAERIERHRAARAQNPSWQTLEAPLDLAGAVRSSGQYPVLLVDCLTLWVNNLLYAAEQAGTELTEEEMARRCQELLEACRMATGSVLLVSNEVGMGIMPDNPLARRFQDLLGRCNQVLAAGADTVIWMNCGLAVKLKP